MRKILLLLAMPLLAATLNSSCKKTQEDDYAKMILGTWEITHIESIPWIQEPTSMTIKADGTYSVVGFFGTGNGTYTLTDKTGTCYVAGVKMASCEILDLTKTECRLKFTPRGEISFEIRGKKK